MSDPRPVQVVIYVPSDTLDELDKRLSRKASRSAWVVEAIREKLDRETVDDD